MHDAGQSVGQHFMSSYHHAVLAVILAQFTAKGFADGMEGVTKLIQASPYLQVPFPCWHMVRNLEPLPSCMAANDSLS